MGRAIMPITIEIASLITMKSSIVRQPPIQIMLFMKPESTDRPQKRAAIAGWQGGGRGTGHWHLKLNPSEVSVSINRAA